MFIQLFAHFKTAGLNFQHIIGGNQNQNRGNSISCDHFWVEEQQCQRFFSRFFVGF